MQFELGVIIRCSHFPAYGSSLGSGCADYLLIGASPVIPRDCRVCSHHNIKSFFTTCKTQKIKEFVAFSLLKGAKTQYHILLSLLKNWRFSLVTIAIAVWMPLFDWTENLYNHLYDNNMDFYLKLQPSRLRSVHKIPMQPNKDLQQFIMKSFENYVFPNTFIFFMNAFFFIHKKNWKCK